MPVWWMKGEISLHLFFFASTYGIIMVDGRIGEIRKPECRCVGIGVWQDRGMLK